MRYEMRRAKERRSGRVEQNAEENNSYVCRVCGRTMRYVGWDNKNGDDEWKCKCGVRYFPELIAESRDGEHELQGITCDKKRKIFFGGDN